MFDKEKFIEFALDNDVVGFAEIGNPITLSSGRKSYWYANWRKISNDVYLIDKLSDYIIDFVQGWGLNPESFIGVPEGATKVGIVTQYKWASSSPNYALGSHVLPMMRAVPKIHGKLEDRQYLGIPGQNSVVLEDVTTTGDSLFGAIVRMGDAMRGEPFLGSAVSITDRSEGRAEHLIKGGLDIPFHAMTTSRDLLPRAYQKLQPRDEIWRAIQNESP